MNGLRVVVDARWVTGCGYRPIKLTFHCTPVARADRSLRVEVFPNSWNRSYSFQRTAVFVRIPEGSTKVTKTVYLPEQDVLSHLRLEFYEDGVQLEDLSMERGHSVRLSNSRGDREFSPSLLFLDADAPSLAEQQGAASQAKQLLARQNTFDLPDPRQLHFLYRDYFELRQEQPDLPPPARGSDAETLAWDHGNIDLLPPIDIPVRSLGLSSADIVFIPLPDLKRIASDLPERFNSLTDHIRTGATLIVYDVGAEFSRLNELDGLFDRRGGPVLTIPSLWQMPKDSAFGQYLESFSTFSQRYNLPTADATSRASKQNEPLAVARAEFRWRDFGLGTVVAIDARDPFHQEQLFWHWVLKTLGEDRWLWSRRHGMSLTYNNPDFWDFLIPGVGGAPVMSFLVTIAIFVITIGPVNYFFLSRSRRLYLLPVTVPLAAGATTIVMVLYAVLSDGLSTRVRARSFTLIDQPRAESVSWSRQTYYAALAPSNGLSFPADACVYPLDPFVRDARQSGVPRYDEQDDDTRTFSKGYLNSRETAQFVIVQAGHEAGGLQVVEHESTLNVRNELGTAMEWLWIGDSTGKLHMAKNVKEQQNCETEPIESTAARQQLDELLRSTRPLVPPGLDKNLENSLLGNVGRRSWSQFGPPRAATSLLERNLLSSRDFFPPKPKTYLAVTRRAPRAVPLGAAARQTIGFHVIRGRW